MAAMTVLRDGSISVIDYRCTVGPADEPFVELHGGFSVNYVRKGSFGYRALGASFELVAGSVLFSLRLLREPASTSLGTPSPPGTGPGPGFTAMLRTHPTGRC